MTVRKEAGKFLIPNPPKINLPLFTGENSGECIRKCNEYNLNYQIPEEQKVEVIEMYLEGRADKWFQGVKLEKPGITWRMFEELLYKIFDNRNGKDVVEEFNKLQQARNVEEYQERFEELKTLMMIKNPHLDEEYFISSFISGLKDEIKTMIRMLRPTTLSQTFEMATLQEDALRLQTRTSKDGWKTIPKNIFGISRNSSQQQIHSSYCKVPSTCTLKNTSFKGKPISSTDSEPKKISAQEVQYRRNNGLVSSVEKKEEESEFEDALGEQDESIGNPGQVMEMSLHALFVAMKRKTITLIGKLDCEETLILVDTRSSDSYISSEKVIAFDIPYRLVDPFSIIVGNGACVTSKAICPKVVWGINQYKFCYDLKVMDLSSWDIILGVDWMTHFSPITFDFHQLTISLHNQGEVVQGQTENCVLDLIRGGDLRNFIEYKKQMCLAMRIGQDNPSGEYVMPTEVQEIIEEFANVFETPTKLPPTREIDHEIPLKPGSQPFKMKTHRYPHS
ncbi:uncharacterized protein [Coffea arabica]|uniref:Ty3 transposon capsid-like protein domain-containing protein n=1 Tax=Coffea arabica TaxID=13443 RepID=A0A6P6UDX6_COFAR|nr:uncharacterized protein LOC113710005 [Coffea arabica]